MIPNHPNKRFGSLKMGKMNGLWWFVSGFRVFSVGLFLKIYTIILLNSRLIGIYVCILKNRSRNMPPNNRDAQQTEHIHRPNNSNKKNTKKSANGEEEFARAWEVRSSGEVHSSFGKRLLFCVFIVIRAFVVFCLWLSVFVLSHRSSFFVLVFCVCLFVCFCPLSFVYSCIMNRRRDGRKT